MWKISSRNKKPLCNSVLEDEQELDIVAFNKVLMAASDKVLGYKKNKKEEWITGDTWKKIDERKETKKKLNQVKPQRLKDRLQTAYSEQDKEVKRMTRKDKKEFVDKLADEAENAAERRDLRSLYKITKTLTGGFHNNDRPVKDINDKVVTSEREQVERWAEYFRAVLNRQDPDTIAKIPEALEDIDVRVDPPTQEEIRRAIETLKDGKAPGEDGICVEILKVGEPEISGVLAAIFKTMWEEERLPEDWQTGLLFKLPKKGDLGNCKNWRGIMQLSTTNKVFSKIILNRLGAGIDPQLRNEQAGFRKGKSCSDHIFTLRQILEQSKEWNTTLYATFIDLAFDSVHSESLRRIPRHYGIPSKTVNIIRMLYSDFKAKVICGPQLSESFSIKTGVKQGCILSSFLFTLCIDWLMKETTKTERRGITWTLTNELEDIDFSDDICLLSQSHNDMQQKTNDLNANGGCLGFKTSTSKTKEMRMNSKSREPITVREGAIEAVNDFIYLGSKMQADGDSKPDVKRRISKASQAFSMLKIYMEIKETQPQHQDPYL